MGAPKFSRDMDDVVTAVFVDPPIFCARCERAPEFLVPRFRAPSDDDGYTPDDLLLDQCSCCHCQGAIGKDADAALREWWLAAEAAQDGGAR